MHPSRHLARLLEVKHILMPLNKNNLAHPSNSKYGRDDTRGAILCARVRRQGIAALQCPEFCADGTAPVPPVLRTLRVTAPKNINRSRSTKLATHRENSGRAKASVALQVAVVFLEAADFEAAEFLLFDEAFDRGGHALDGGRDGDAAGDGP